MKNNILFILVLAIIIFVGCDEDRLYLTNPNSSSFEKTMKTEDGVTSMVLPLYEGLRSKFNFSSQIGKPCYYLSDVFNINSSYEGNQINKFQVNPSFGSPGMEWGDNYNQIAQINAILDAMDEAEMNDELRERYKGDLYFLRAVHYFNLVRLFGDLPIVTEPVLPDEARNVPRSDVSIVYEQIESDLLKAIDGLPEQILPGEYGRAGKMASKGILARVYLTMPEKQWEKAKVLLKDIIQSNQFEFHNNFEEIFSRDDLQQKFYVFPIRFDVTNPDHKNATRWWTQMMPSDVDPDVWQTVGAVFFPMITQDLINSYESGDRRRDATICRFYLKFDGTIVMDKPWLRKFHHGATSDGYMGNDFPLLRYTDVLLMFAETCNELNEDMELAYQYLNDVRSRAGLGAIYPTVGEPFRNALFMERKHEFAGEGLRWFDLVRSGTAITVMNMHFQNEPFKNDIEIDQHNLLFPIPQTEIDRFNNMKQNFGY